MHDFNMDMEIISGKASEKNEHTHCPKHPCSGCPSTAYSDRNKGNTDELI
jgi:hypothetical protein